jgi:hypothetical protein
MVTVDAALGHKGKPTTMPCNSGGGPKRACRRWRQLGEGALVIQPTGREDPGKRAIGD